MTSNPLIISTPSSDLPICPDMISGTSRSWPWQKLSLSDQSLVVQFKPSTHATTHQPTSPLLDHAPGQATRPNNNLHLTACANLKHARRKKEKTMLSTSIMSIVHAIPHTIIIVPLFSFLNNCISSQQPDTKRNCSDSAHSSTFHANCLPTARQPHHGNTALSAFSVKAITTSA